MNRDIYNLVDNVANTPERKDVLAQLLKLFDKMTTESLLTEVAYYEEEIDTQNYFDHLFRENTRHTDKRYLRVIADPPMSTSVQFVRENIEDDSFPGIEFIYKYDDPDPYSGYYPVGFTYETMTVPEQYVQKLMRYIIDKLESKIINNAKIVRVVQTGTGDWLYLSDTQPAFTADADNSKTEKYFEDEKRDHYDDYTFFAQHRE